MKREWQKPELETLEVNQTMFTDTGTRLDNDQPAGTLLEDVTLS